MEPWSQVNRRSGITAVEFAVVAPLLFLFFFAAVEFCRVGIVPGATSAEVRAETLRMMNTLGVSNVVVAVIPATIDRHSEEVTVRLEVPLDGNSFVPNQFVAGRSVVRQLTLRREG